MDHYREVDVDRFVRLGAIAVAVVAAFGWFMHDLASRRMRPANLEPPTAAAWASGAAAGQGLVAPIRR
ncbi:MAG TPA: hypothetical protein VHL98_08490 [Microvirga sp.]|jgi:hypothetical protein|nr:hypothetical protein [Microvirga sp.]